MELVPENQENVVFSKVVNRDDGILIAGKRRWKGGDGGHGAVSRHPTSYMETLMHLLKGNIGSGAFAMGDAFKNGGLVLATVLTLFIAIVNVHNQHILLKYSRKMKEKFDCEYEPDFAETVELAFESSPRLQKWSKAMKIMVNIFICITQIGFSAIYLVFISTSIKQISDFYGYELDVRLHMLIWIVPILLPSLITNLKYLAPYSTIANILMATGIGVVFYYAFQDLPHPSERNYVTPHIRSLPLYFGTAIFAFEVISLMLPLQNSMQNPSDFSRPAGVLNIGMTIVTTLYIAFGFFGYLKWGEDVAGSLTLNLPQSEILAQVVKVTVSLGMWLTFPLQFFIAIQIIWPHIDNKFGPFKSPAYELMFRTFMVLLTFAIAELVPRLNLFISLIGALCSTALSLVFPPIIQLITTWGTPDGKAHIFAKNIFILVFAVVAFATGTYESISSLVDAFFVG